MLLLWARVDGNVLVEKSWVTGIKCKQGEYEVKEGLSCKMDRVRCGGSVIRFGDKLEAVVEVTRVSGEDVKHGEERNGG